MGVTITEEDLYEYTESNDLAAQVEGYLNDTIFIAEDPYGFDLCTEVADYEIITTWEEED